MRRATDRSARCRAVLSVAALYALLLQGFLVALHPVAPPAGGVICAAHDGGVPADDGLPCVHHACCVAAQAAHALLEPVAAPATAVPWRRAAPRVWRAADARAARAPPDPAASPRGPPPV